MKINLISLSISIVSMILLVFVIYQMVDYITPPITIDGHRYMPTSNVLKSVFYSLLLSIIIFFISRKVIKGRMSK